MKLLTVRDVAEILNVSPKTVYYWCYLNMIPHLKVGGSVRFYYEEVVAWLKGFKKGPDGGYTK